MAAQQAMSVYLIPGPIGEHASKEGVHVPSIHGLAVLLDALSISKDQALPQQGITLSELICDLPVPGATLCLRQCLQTAASARVTTCVIWA